LNVPGIVGMGYAIELAVKELKTSTKKYKEYSDYVWLTLKENFNDIILNGTTNDRLPHNLNISVPHVESKALIVQLKNVAISAGSACTTTSVEPSHVIMALGFGEDRAHNAIRISVGRFTTKEDIKIALTEIVNAIKNLRSIGKSVT